MTKDDLKKVTIFNIVMISTNTFLKNEQGPLSFSEIFFFVNNYVGLGFGLKKGISKWKKNEINLKWYEKFSFNFEINF